MTATGFMRLCFRMRLLFGGSGIAAAAGMRSAAAGAGAGVGPGPGLGQHLCMLFDFGDPLWIGAFANGTALCKRGCRQRTC